MEHTYLEYIYQPLPNAADWIRLLCLYPSHPNFEGKLLGRLISYPRAATPGYTPISYTWDEQQPTSEILLYDDARSRTATSPKHWPAVAVRRMPIRPNLELALREFRPTAKWELWDRFFWIDAICINQDHDMEKAKQVRHMDKVYRGQEVHIWLGGPSAKSDLALDLIEEIQRLPWKNYMTLKRDDPFDVANLPAGAGRLVSLERRDHWHAIWDLLSRPWFTRRWIVQETVLARKRLFYVGHGKFGWEELFRAATLPDSQKWSRVLRPLASWWDKYPMSLSRRDQPSLRCRLYSPHVSPFLSLVSAYVAARDGDNLTLLRLLETFVGFKSKDLRDSIYAFISMASDIKDGTWLPDYSDKNTAAQVYRQAAYQIISTAGGRTDFLCRTYPDVSKAVLESSWLPVFGPMITAEGLNVGDAQMFEESAWSINSLVTFGQAPWKAPDVYSACAGHLSTLVKSTSNYLSLDGVQVATIRKLGPKKELGVIHIDGETGIILAKQEDFGMLGAVNNDLDSLPDQFFRAVTGNRVEAQAGQPVENVDYTPSHFPPADWVEIVRSTFAQVPQFSGKARTVSLKEQRMALTSAKIVLSAKRRLAVTDTSMGFVPSLSELDDKIFILAGCSVPVVLRRLPSADTGDSSFECELVGECYLDGVMDGEYLIARDGGAQEVKWEKVVIH